MQVCKQWSSTPQYPFDLTCTHTRTHTYASAHIRTHTYYMHIHTHPHARTHTHSNESHACRLGVNTTELGYKQTTRGEGHHPGTLSHLRGSRGVPGHTSRVHRVQPSTVWGHNLAPISTLHSLLLSPWRPVCPPATFRNLLHVRGMPATPATTTLAKSWTQQLLSPLFSFQNAFFKRLNKIKGVTDISSHVIKICLSGRSSSARHPSWCKHNTHVYRVFTSIHTTSWSSDHRSYRYPGYIACTGVWRSVCPAGLSQIINFYSCPQSVTYCKLFPCLSL